MGTRPENNGGTWEPDMVIFQYEVSDIDLSMARLQLIGIVSRAPYRQNAFMHQKKNRTLKFLQGVSKKTHHKDFNSFGSEIPLYDINPAIQILI